MSFIYADNKQYIINTNTGESLLYVHKYVKNFEAAAASTYFKQKQKYGEQMLERYRSRLMDSITLTEQTKQLFNYTTRMGQEDLFKALDEGVSSGLENAIAKTSTDLSVLSNQARKAYDQNSISSINQIIVKINQAAELVFGKTNALSLLLNNYLSAGNLNLTGLSSELATQLSMKDQEGRIIGFSQSGLNIAAASLNNLIIAAQSQNLSKSNITGYLNNIFSIGFGESLVAQGVARKMVNGTDELIDSFLVGAKTPIQRSSKFADDYSSLINATFKPDVSTGNENFYIKVNDVGDQIGIQLGVSVKQYASMNDGVSIVTGKPFNQVLGALFADGKYYVYNTLGLLSDTQSQYREMKKAIVLAYADNFLSGTGMGSDFAQYIVINGKVYPIYDILKSVVNNTTGALSGDTDASDPVVISISGASALQKLRNAYPGRDSKSKAWERSKEVNRIISGDLTVHGTLVPSRIK